MSRYRHRAAIVAAVTVIVLGVAVALLGWAGGYDLMTRLLPGAVTMKPLPSLSFADAGVVVLLQLMGPSLHGVTAGIVGTLSVLLMGHFALLATTLIDNASGVRALLPGAETAEAVQTVVPNLPSMGTMTMFGLIGWAGFLRTIAHDEANRYTRAAGYVVGLICLVALLGYVAEWCGASWGHALYYYWPDTSTGMAIHTAGGGALLGYAMTRVGFEP